MKRRTDRKRWLLPLAILSLLAGLSACGKFEADSNLNHSSTSSHPGTAKLENDQRDAATNLIDGASGPKRQETASVSAVDTPLADAAAMQRKMQEMCGQLPDTCAGRGDAGTPAPTRATGASSGTESVGIAASVRSQLVARIERVAKLTKALNESIEPQRAEIVKYVAERSKMSAADQRIAALRIARFKKSYKLPETETVEAVLERVDVVPVALLVAVVAIDPEFGKSDGEDSKGLEEFVATFNTSDNTYFANARKIRAIYRKLKRPLSSSDMAGNVAAASKGISRESFIKLVNDSRTIIREEPSLKWIVQSGLESASAK